MEDPASEWNADVQREPGFQFNLLIPDEKEFFAEL
jgi:hypothetical protein